MVACVRDCSLITGKGGGWWIQNTIGGGGGACEVLPLCKGGGKSFGVVFTQ